MNKIILVTGGAGFIGSHLCEELVKFPKNTVYSLDNYSTGSINNHVKGVKYIKGDTKDISKHIVFIPDYIYHLGEYARVEQSFNEIQSVWHSNKSGTFSVIEFCRKNGVKLIYAGSSTKFGDGGLGRNQSPYAWTKASNTELIINYGNWFNLPYAIVYFYNAYGEREIAKGKYATLIAIFKEKIMKNEPLTVVSPGTQKRNFTYVKDIIKGIILVGENGYGDNFGIGNDESYTVLEIAKMFGENIKMLPERKGNRMTADIMTKKTKALGWKPTTNIQDYIEFFKKSSNKKA